MDAVGNRTLRDLLIERERRYGESTCLVFVDEDSSVTEFTYTEFLDRVLSVATGFDRLGIAKGDKVVVHLPNCPQFLFAWFGLAWIGVVTVPSNIENHHAELDHVISFSDAVGVVTNLEHKKLVGAVADDNPAVKLRVLVDGVESGWTSWPQVDTGGTPPHVEIDSSDLAELLFTSGTTALPKAIMLTHANCLFTGEREGRIMGLTPDDRCLTALPAFHSNAQGVTILPALSAGATAILLAGYSARRFWRTVREQRATVLSLVSMLVRTLLAQPAQPDDADNSVRRIIYAFAITDEEKDAFERRFDVQLTNLYGLTEAMVLVTLAPLFGDNRWPSVGLPIGEREVRVVTEDDSDAAPGEVGEIIVRGVPGRSLMKGYYKNPEATAKSIRDGWLYTGDQGYLDEYGYLYFYDRHIDVLKVAGENVSATEVEGVLRGHPDITDAAVVPVKHAIRDQVPVAFVLRRPGSDVSTDEVREYCREWLAKFKVPAIIEFAEELPKTSIGKIEKKALRAIVDTWEAVR